MTARDRYTVNLKCQCGNTGLAHVSEADGYIGPYGGGPDRRIDELPPGFSGGVEGVRTKFKCLRCGSDVRH